MKNTKRVRFTVDNIQAVYSLQRATINGIVFSESVPSTLNSQGMRYYLITLEHTSDGLSRIHIRKIYSDVQVPDIPYKDFQALSLIPDNAKYEYLKALILA